MDWIGRTLSKVTVQKLLGRGGMAEVYLGLHNTLNRPVAVKILHGHLLEDDVLMERFRSEAQAVASLRHPNIVQVLDFDIIEDRPYIIMELLEGPSLADYLGALRKRGEKLSFDTIGRIITAMAGALDYAHGRGIVHRDVKPSNVLLRTETGLVDPAAALPDDIQPVLTDFGVARMANATLRTASGAIVGTPAYMSPEQISGTTVDARSDIYSLGVMLYELLSGRLPFSSENDTVASALLKHITEPPLPLPEVSRDIQAVVFRALAKDRNDRYSKASEMALELRDALGIPLGTREMNMLRASATYPTPTELLTRPLPPAEKPSRSRRALWVTAMITLLLVAVGVGILLANDVFKDQETGTPAVSGQNVDETPEESYGVLGFGNSSGHFVNQAVLLVTNLAPPPDDKHYEAWLLGAETRRSIGVLEVDSDGRGELTFIDNTGENLLVTFERFEITVEPSPDPNPLPTGDPVYSGAVPMEPLIHIRHLLTAFNRTPDSGGLVMNLTKHARLIADSAAALSEAERDGELEMMKRASEAMVNIIEGEGGEHFGDLDGDGEINNPGDGFGLLPGAQNAGYIQTAIEHARYSAGTATATANILHQVRVFETAAQNLGGWAAQLRDAALSIIDSEDVASATPSVEQITALAVQFGEGHDASGIMSAEPVQDAGGAEIVMFYALRMADMPVLAGMNRVPGPDVNYFLGAENDEEYEETNESTGEVSHDESAPGH